MVSTEAVYIPQGSIAQIITYLEEKNFDIAPNVDKYLLYSIGQPQSGWIDVGKNNLTIGDFLYKLTTSKAAMKTLTLIPGETIDIFLLETSKEFSLSYDELMKAYLELSPLRDGFIVPETYKVPMGIEERHLIGYLVSYALDYNEKISLKIFGKFDKESWYRYLIIASIIQKEAANEEEMKLVSSVIYNRLKIGMPLQMDGTLNYGKYSHVAVTAQRIKEDKSKYNTYIHKGLPPVPISSVKKEAIIAAIFPKKTNYKYFVKSKNGDHIFSASYAEHIKNIYKLR
jgi:UPF0755 protein